MVREQPFKVVGGTVKPRHTHKWVLYLYSKCSICVRPFVYWHIRPYGNVTLELEWSIFGQREENEMGLFKLLSKIKNIRVRSHLATMTQIFDVVSRIFYVVRNGLHGYQCNCSHMTTGKNASLSSSANGTLPVDL